MRVVIVGAGATGLGTAWDLALRGIEVLVVEQGDIAHGTSGRFHGLLHSGARYAVRDPKAAEECYQENRILRTIAQGSVEPVGGYFIETVRSDVAYRERWREAMERLGIPAREVSVADLKRQTPELHAGVRRAFSVPDGVINGFSLLFRLRRGIEQMGGSVRLFSRLTEVEISVDGRVIGVQVASVRGDRERISCDALVNAAGPYAGRVAELFGDPFAMRLSRGVMVVFSARKIPWVINRLAPPGDGDILVPHDRISIWGTTDEPATDPDALPPDLSETRQVVQLADDLFPEMPRWRVLRAFSGVRPLYQEQQVKDSRHVTRDFTILDHEHRGGPKGVVSVVGGKWVTYRLMAERAADLIAESLGVKVPSKTKTTVLPLLETRGESEMNLCECEDVGATAIEAWPELSLNQLRTRTWFSMGPCQGTFCVHRVAGMRLDQGVAAVDQEIAALRRERERGITAALWGDNAREWALSRAIRYQLLDERPVE
jgi:glycerol-3-phosphate dehydrogenase